MAESDSGDTDSNIKITSRRFEAAEVAKKMMRVKNATVVYLIFCLQRKKNRPNLRRTLFDQSFY